MIDNREGQAERHISFSDFEKEINYEPDIYENLVLEVACERARCGISQQELAVAIGTTQSAISRFENLGRQPSLGFLERIASSLGHKLHVTIFGEYQAPLTADHRATINEEAVFLGESTQQVAEIVLKEGLRVLDDRIHWRKVKLESSTVDVEDSPQIVSLTFEGRDHTHASLEQYFGATS